MKTNYFNPDKRNKPLYGHYKVKQEYEDANYRIEFNFEVLREFPEFKNKSESQLKEVCKIAAKSISTVSGI